MNTAEILRAAAARVRQGWCQGSADDGNGGVCAIGSIWAVTNSSVFDCSNWPIRQFLARAIGLSVDEHYCSIPGWNDARGQTAENVAIAMEFAAVLWEQEQAQADDAVAAPVRISHV